MQRAVHILQAIRKLGEERIPLTRVYRSLYSEDLFFNAYGKIYRNEGATTPGSTGNTADDMSIDRIRRTIEALRYERFYFQPVRRAYADKKNGGQRPLGQPDFDDKLVQEVLRQMLEAYYEPRFCDSSHGFRPGRGCHTALLTIKQKFAGTTWFIEGDIKGCFDNIDHEVLLSILARDIQDGRLLELIRRSLKAGVMEEWTYKPTYNGVPQGGILSPLLSNIYLNELDRFIEDELIPQYSRGKQRAMNPEYARVTQQVRTARRRGDPNLDELIQRRRQLPSGDTQDPHFRRLKYCRYADDFILGLIGPRHEAEAIKAAIGVFLRDKLHLQMSEPKTLITHARTEQASFLGYAISVQQANDKIAQHGSVKHKKLRSVNGTIRLGIPYGLVQERAQRYQRNGKIMQEGQLLKYSDAHIIDTFQSRFRGLAEYYRYAADRNRLNHLKYIMQVALVKTLAGKFKIRATQVYRRYHGRMVVDDHEYRTLQVEVPTKHGTRLIYWGAISLRVQKLDWNSPLIREQEPYPKEYARNDLITRLKAHTCELCGSTERIRVHHVRKLSDLKQRWSGRKEKPKWVQRMIALQRKTLIVCHECHIDIHAGRPTPDFRETSLESRVQ
jgi:group II intron reverse transcriptase/maturase